MPSAKAPLYYCAVRRNNSDTMSDLNSALSVEDHWMYDFEGGPVVSVELEQIQGVSRLSGDAQSEVMHMKLTPRRFRNGVLYA